MRDVAGLMKLRTGDADSTSGYGLFFVVQKLWGKNSKIFQNIACFWRAAGSRRKTVLFTI
jgi:hypothetical protein